MTLLLLYAVLSIVISFLCSILEAALLSFTPTYLRMKTKEGKQYANTLTNYKKDIDKPLIAILTLNTIAHTVGAILVGVEAEKLPYKVDFMGMNLVGIVSAVMTMLILVTSEIIPKTIGATYWKKLAVYSYIFEPYYFPFKIYRNFMVADVDYSNGWEICPCEYDEPGRVYGNYRCCGGRRGFLWKVKPL